jgi:hypothetical protein
VRVSVFRSHGPVSVAGVSLAGALAVPDTMADGRPFEYKSLIVFITAGVIVVTLFGQGMSLPRVIKWAHYDSVDDSAGQRTAEIALTEEGLRYVTDPAQRHTAPSRPIGSTPSFRNTCAP